jgi:hypothetical protein
MAFDARAFAESLEKAADTLAGRLNYEWQQKQEEKRVMREYIAKDKLEEARRIREMETTHKYQKDLTAYSSELDAKRAIELNEHNAMLENYLKSPELMNTVQTYLKSDDPNVRMMGNSTMSLVAKLREGAVLSQDENNFLMKSLPGNSFAPIADLIRANQDRERDYLEQKARIAQYNAIAFASRNRQTGGLQLDDALGIVKAINGIDDDVGKLEQNPMYIHLRDKVNKEQKLDDREKILWDSYMAQLFKYSQSQGLMYGLLKQAQGAGKLSGGAATGGPPPGATKEQVTEPITGKKKGPTGQELGKFLQKMSKVGPVEKAGEAMGGVVGGIAGWPQMVLHPKKKEPITTTANVRQKYNIPKGVRIFTAKSLEDLKKLPGVKKNPPKTGDLIWTGESLHKIQVTDGKITISRESWNE